MKTFLLVFFFVLSLKADSVYDGKCVSKFKLAPNNIIIYFTNSTTTTTIPFTYDDINNLIINDGKFYYKHSGFSSACLYSYTTNYNNLGLTENQFNFLSALTGLLTSILLVFVIFLKV